jgi:serine/threonine-protein kinase
VVKLLDFGISKVTKLDGGGSGETLTQTDTALGSPQYMSPEQVKSAKRVDARSDLWSLGVILQKLLTGRLAFEAESLGAYMVKIVTDPPLLLRAGRPEAPVELERVIVRCLQKDPGLRFQNVGQLALALAPFVDGRTRPLIDAIVATSGREASLAPLPPVADAGAEPVGQGGGPPPPPDLAPPARAPAQDPGTAPGWTPTRSPPAPRRGIYFVATAVLAFAAIALVAGVRLSAKSAADVAPTPSAPAPKDTAGEPPSAAPPAPTAAPAPPAEARALPDVRVTLELEPRDAEIELDGAVVRDNPIRLVRGDRSHRLVIRSPGYLSESREVTPQVDATLRIVLRKAAAAHKSRVPLETNL